MIPNLALVGEYILLIGGECVMKVAIMISSLVYRDGECRYQVLLIEG